MDTTKQEPKGDKVATSKEKKEVIGYTVKALTGTIDKLKRAKIITESEEKVLRDLAETIAVRYVLGKEV